MKDGLSLDQIRRRLAMSRRSVPSAEVNYGGRTHLKQPDYTGSVALILLVGGRMFMWRMVS